MSGFFLGGAAQGMKDAAELGLRGRELDIRQSGQEADVGLRTRALGIAEKAQQYTETRDALGRADTLIAQAMGEVDKLTQAMINQGSTPGEIATNKAVQAVVQHAKDLAATAKRDPAALDGQLAAMIARPPEPSKFQVTGEGVLGDKSYGFVNGSQKTVTPATVMPNAATGESPPTVPAAASAGGEPNSATTEASSFPPSQSKHIQSLIATGYTSQPILDFKALRYNLGDPTVVNSLGRSKAGAAERKAIADRGAELSMYMDQHPEDVNARKAQTTAATQSLVQMTKMKNAIEQFENTAIKNGDVLVQLADKVDKTGVPVVERWIRAGRKELAGDPDVAAFNTQMTLYRAEVAKILTNPNLTGVLTDQARKEVAEGLGYQASASQIRAVHELLKGDFARRNQAIDEQIGKINKSFGTQSAPAAAPAKAPVDWRTYFGSP